MKDKPIDPRRTTKEQKAITEKMAEDLRRELERVGIKPDEWKERYDKIASSTSLPAVTAEPCKP